MSYLPFALLAYLLNSASVTIDKLLLSKNIPNPLIYIFYFSMVSLLALLLLPFTHFPHFNVLFLASLSTLLWTTGAYFMFKALQVGLVSRVIPVIGTLIPIILLFNAFFSGNVTQNQTWAVIVLVLGLMILTLPDWKGKIIRKEIVFVIFSAAFFAISYVFLRQAYLKEEFLTVFAYSRLILIPLGLLLILIPASRKQILIGNRPNVNFDTKAKVLFAAGQISAGFSELLLTFSVFLAEPALVNSLQGTQYVFLFILSVLLSRVNPEVFKESYSKRILFSKIFGILLIALGLYILAQPKQTSANLGLTFSTKYAQGLKLDPKQTYIRMLDDLKVKRLRLPVYWDEIAPDRQTFNKDYLSFYLAEADKRGVEVTLVLGLKQPRWPECHLPDYAKRLDTKTLQKTILGLVSEEVKLFKNYPAVKVWQVENEPLFSFGVCPSPTPLTQEFLKQEVALVKSLDSRPVLITDTGELSSWSKSYPVGDQFGTTLYRNVWSPYLGSFDYPLPPIFYKFKADMIRILTGSQEKKTIVAELQTEPWPTTAINLHELSFKNQLSLFEPKTIKDNVNFAHETGFEDIYLWGVEWWYFMKDNGYPEYVETAKGLPF